MGRSQTVEGPDPPDPGRRDLPDAEPAPLMSERRVSLIGGMLAAIGPVSMALYTPAMTEIVDALRHDRVAGQADPHALLRRLRLPPSCWPGRSRKD